MSKPIGYVVYYEERLRDGKDDGAKCFKTLDLALEFIDEAKKRFFAADNYKFQLFEMGKEIPLDEVVTEVPQPALLTKKTVVREKK